MIAALCFQSATVSNSKALPSRTPWALLNDIAWAILLVAHVILGPLVESNFELDVLPRLIVENLGVADWVRSLEQT